MPSKKKRVTSSPPKAGRNPKSGGASPSRSGNAKPKASSPARSGGPRAKASKARPAASPKGARTARGTKSTPAVKGGARNRKDAAARPAGTASPSRAKSTASKASSGAAQQPAAAKKSRSSRKHLFPAAERQKFRRALLQARSELVDDKESREREALKAAGPDYSVDHMADNGSDNYEQEFTLGLLEKDVEKLRDIDDALARIEEGTFGACEECEERIPLARLEFLPWARLCIECKIREE